jgi:hypothetical protein
MRIIVLSGHLGPYHIAQPRVLNAHHHVTAVELSELPTIGFLLHSLINLVPVQVTDCPPVYK